jgi:formylglycine-generating enzyme
VMGHNPSYFQNEKITTNGKEHPVENISWQQAQAFIRELNKLDQEHFYRLPTEFEWEYAAAAGAKDDILWARAAAMGVISDTSTRAVGSKEPNAWGLYDMIGNVWEWVQDIYNEKIFADPIPPRNGKEHVLKGASFTGDAKNATYKTHAAGPGNGFDIGMRLVIEIRKP